MAFAQLSAPDSGITAPPQRHLVPTPHATQQRDIPGNDPDTQSLTVAVSSHILPQDTIDRLMTGRSGKRGMYPEEIVHHLTERRRQGWKTVDMATEVHLTRSQVIGIFYRRGISLAPHPEGSRPRTLKSPHAPKIARQARQYADKLQLEDHPGATLFVLTREEISPARNTAIRKSERSVPRRNYPARLTCKPAPPASVHDWPAADTRSLGHATKKPALPPPNSGMRSQSRTKKTNAPDPVDRIRKIHRQLIKRSLKSEPKRSGQAAATNIISFPATHTPPPTDTLQTPVPLMDLATNSCRFIISDPGATVLYCGQPIALGTSYCACHTQICYRKTNSRSFNSLMQLACL